MLLKNLINDIPQAKENILITGLSNNSKEIKKNYIFFAIKGVKVNGENYISEAIKKGASVIVCSKSCSYQNNNITLIKTRDIRNLLSEMCAKFYNNKPKNIVAVTGTNGKTSVADLFFQLFRINKLPAASIGTLGVKYNNKVIKTHLTSPDTISIHKHLFFLKKKGVDNVIIEASSHGLDQKRLHHLNIKTAIFTNFSQDHLDYHKTMKNYLNAKLILFREILNKNSQIICDKETAQFKKLKQLSKVKKLRINEISYEIKKIYNFYNSSYDYKIKNLAMAILAAKSCGLKDKFLYPAIKHLKDVTGRQELVRKYTNNIKVFIDFAHTPDALLKTLYSLKNNHGNNLSLVFGCGGERDKKKRPMMAKIADKFCKKIYITDDNPRNENPEKIRNEISKFIEKNKSFKIGNRALAIKTAIKNSEPNEVILIAGKGHEEKQIYKNKIIKISDKKIVKNIKIKKKFLSNNHLNVLQNKFLLNKTINKKLTFQFNGISIDSRLLKKDNLFLTIKGKKTDGKKFIKNAIKKGAKCIVTSSNIKVYKKKIIKVKNTIQFLKQFAYLKRKYTSAKIISVTGSAGKTSLKDLLKNILRNFGNTYASPKSYNNQLGVPISLANMGYNDKFGIFEVGMSKSGEIRKLSKLIKPQIGIITNIGEAHLENFNNISGIAKAKSEIFENIEAGGTIILNRDDKFFNFLSKKAKFYNLKVLTFGKHKGSDVRLKKIKKNRNLSRLFINFDKRSINFEIRDLNIYNVLASIAVLKELKINFDKIKSKFIRFEPSAGRGRQHEIIRYKKKFRLIDESYNANPLSVKNSIKRLNSIKKKKFKKYLILGDMLELGNKSKKLHKDLSKVINNSDIDKVFVKGKKTIFTYKHLNKDKRGNILQNDEDIDLILRKILSNNDYLLIKGSNATGLNKFSNRMVKGI